MPPRFYANPFQKDSATATLVAVEPLQHDMDRNVVATRGGTYITKHSRASYSDGTSFVAETERKQLMEVVYSMLRPRK